MHCPFCQATDTRVIDSRLKGEGFQIRRRRECAQCGARFNTFETPELKLPNVVKSGGNREAFDPEKLPNTSRKLPSSCQRTSLSSRMKTPSRVSWTMPMIGRSPDGRGRIV